MVRAQLIDGTRDAFTSGTSLLLRVGAEMMLTTALIAHQHPKGEEATWTLRNSGRLVMS